MEVLAIPSLNRCLVRNPQACKNCIHRAGNWTGFTPTLHIPDTFSMMLATLPKELASGQDMYDDYVCVLGTCFKMHSTRFEEPIITQDLNNNNSSNYNNSNN